ncbi:MULTISPECIES: hypothetical protein [Vibrio]|uniref:hypothetical protein n=1 Tax=Vibrio TaxID=662 RepID=UPI001BD42217|nr:MULTISPECIES: hypothetical protein [Vibrio]MBT0118284.1 site-specific integrase [Vibrio alginolyticus]MCG9235860.1 hypothetical protein [Vibrio harveyi]MCG9586081.1 hypothetical protein [Vibrio harveyi]NRB69760.1 site-specific integrase [Vibrio sp.]
MNKLEKKQSGESASCNLSDEQIEFIKSMKLPSIMEITVGSEFDTPYVQTKNNRWEYDRFGSTYTNIFDLDENSNKLLKLLSIKYADSHMSPLAKSFIYVKKMLRESQTITFQTFYNWLELKAKSNGSSGYFEIKAITKYLIRMKFPGFDIEDEVKLSRVATPNTANPFLRYQDVENTMPSHLKSLIVKRLVEFSTKEGLESLSDVELKSLSVLALSYIAGPRPMQFSMLTGRSVKRAAYNAHTKLTRYQLSVPIAKQSKVVVESTKIALTEEVGIILEEYKKRFNIRDADPLYPYTSTGNQTADALSMQLHQALNNALLLIQSDETKAFIKENKKDRPTYSLYDFRHNIAHSMAMMNASAEEIATVLGHSSTVAAQHYIMATPELALLKHKSLGQNPIWQNMMGLLLTGYSVEEKDWKGHTVSGMLKGKLIKRIGGCNRHQKKCHLQKVRSCYGCFYFRPFKDVAKHQAVLEIVTNEFLDTVQVSSDSGDQNNPLIDTATQTKNEVEMVINRLNGGLR